MKNNKYYSEFGYKIWFKLKPFVRALLRIKAEGLENFPSKSGFIIAANHRSHLDPPVINTISPFPVMFMAKKELFEVPVFGKFIEKAGAIPVERGKKGTKSLIKALELLKTNHTIGIFPEGTRADPGEYLKPQAGVGLLVSKAKVPVVPVKIEGTDKVFPKGAKFPKLLTSPIEVKVGKPLNFDDDLKYEDISNEIMEVIKKL